MHTFTTMSRDFDRLVHDLKTPLSTIRVLAQLTHGQLERQGEHALAERMSRIEQQVLRIGRLLDAALESEQHAT